MAYNYKKKTAEERKLEIDSLTDEMDVNLRNYATDPKELEAFLVFMSQFMIIRWRISYWFILNLKVRLALRLLRCLKIGDYLS